MRVDKQKRRKMNILDNSSSIARTASVILLIQLIASVSSHSHHHQHNQQVEPGRITSIDPKPSSLSGRAIRHVHDEIKFVDLSYPLNNETLHWPKNKGVRIYMDINDERTDPKGAKYHVRSDSIDMATHTGTHIDAPSHFSKDGWSVDKIPLERLIDVPAIIIDLSDKVKANRSYSFAKSDFHTKEGESLIKSKTVVLVYTGISQFYNEGYKGYIGMEKNSNISQMKVPGFSLEAAKYLVEQGIYGVGLDAISADSSERHADESKYDPQAHVSFNSHNVYILENVNKNLKDLVGERAPRLMINPLPIVGGTGSPVRLVALLGHEDHQCVAKNGAKSSWLLNNKLIATLLGIAIAVMI